jgi:hypothetical protein
MLSLDRQIGLFKTLPKRGHKHSKRGPQTILDWTLTKSWKTHSKTFGIIVNVEHGARNNEGPTKSSNSMLEESSSYIYTLEEKILCLAVCLKGIGEIFATLFFQECDVGHECTCKSSSTITIHVVMFRMAKQNQ